MAVINRRKSDKRILWATGLTLGFLVLMNLIAVSYSLWATGEIVRFMRVSDEVDAMLARAKGRGF